LGSVDHQPLVLLQQLPCRLGDTATRETGIVKNQEADE
jgi:hypothetical protein